MNSSGLSDKNKLPSTDDLLSSLVLNAQNESKRIYKAKTGILPYYKFKKWLKPSKKLLQSVVNTVIYTNGIDNLNEEETLIKHSADKVPVPWLGVDKTNLELSETVMIDIDSESTNLPVFCKILIIHQGAVHVRSPALLSRDVSVQVGNNFNLNSFGLEKKSTEELNKLKRSSWHLIDEYYSTPFYQYRGKSSGHKYNQDTQVNENEFITYANNDTSTEDLISHLKLHIHTKLDIMSELSLNKTLNDYRMIHSPVVQKRSRQISDSCSKDCANLKILNQPNIKRYENVCSLTGTRRLTLIMPPTSNVVELDHNIIKELEYLKHPNKYEEYSVVDACVDTSDLNKYILFENFTYIQLLSDFAFIGKGIQKLSISDKKSSSFTGNKTNHHNHNHNHPPQNQQPLQISKNKEDKKPVYKSNNIATQTDQVKKINESLVLAKKERPASSISPPAVSVLTTTTTPSTTDYNYDISDILERYNLKQLVANSLLSQESDKRSSILSTPRSKLKSADSIKSTPEKHALIDTKDLSLDLTQILSGRENQLQSSRSNRSNSSGRNLYQHVDLDNATNDYLYYYYNSHNSKYPLISKAVTYSNRSNDNELLTNTRSKSSKPILIRTRTPEKSNDLNENVANKRKSLADSPKFEKSPHESVKKHVEFKSNQENGCCCKCQNKKRQSRYEKPMKREQEIFLKIDKNNSSLIENNPNIILIPAVITTSSHHHRDDLRHHHHHKNNEIITIPSRYRRSKYDRSLYMYSDKKSNSNASSSSNESDDTTIINLTRRFKTNYQEDTNNQVDNARNQLGDQLII